MSYVTRCPACGTAFRVGPEQLDVRQGYVRCGQCAKVFDARIALSGEPPSAATLPEPPRAPIEEIVVEAPVSLPPLSIPPPRFAEEPEISLADPDAASTFEFGPLRHRRSGIITALWGGASLAAALLLAGQAAYLYRADLAVQMPASRPWLERLCGHLNCTVPPPQHADRLSIESSDLQIEKGVPGLLTLNATLRNRAGYAQGYPLLELTLTDPDERAVARRVVYPREYIGERLAREPVFAGNSEQVVRLAIDASQLRAAGYRLFLFYP